MLKIIPNKKVNHFLPYFLLFLLAFIWGTSFFMVKNGLETLPPLFLAAFRMLSASLFFLPIALYHFKKIYMGKIIIIIIIGLVSNGIPAILFSFAQTYVSSSVSGIINSNSPLFTFLLGIIFFQQSATLKKIVGILLGLVGVFILIFLKPDGSFDAHFQYALLIVLATLLYGLASNLAGKYLNDIPFYVSASWAVLPMGVIALIYFAFSFSQLASIEISAIDVQYSILATLYLGIIATGLGTSLFFYLIKKKSPLFASTVTYLMPIVALFWGFISGESISLYTFIGLFAILGGVYYLGKKS